MTTADSSNASSPSPGRRRRLPRFSRGLTLAATLGATALAAQVATTSEAQAGVPKVLREGTRPMAFMLGLGPSWGIGGSRWYYGGGPDGYYGPGGYGWGGRYGGSFKLTQEFLGHFSGNASGAALGVIVNQTFSGPYFGFAIAPKFTYDIRVKPGLGLYISPSISLGYALQHYRAFYYQGYYSGANYHAANLQFGVAVKLILDDRWLVFAQVPNFDFLIGPGNYYYYNGGCAPGFNCGTFFAARLDFILGGGVTF
jgi:hypothetical protein